MESLKQTFRNIGFLWSTEPCPMCDEADKHDTEICPLCDGFGMVSSWKARDYKELNK